MNTEELLRENPFVMLYFYNDACAPCITLRPKVEELVKSDFPNIRFVMINAAEQTKTAAVYGIYSSPVILIFIEGKEYIRESKNISISELREKIGRLYSMFF